MHGEKSDRNQIWDDTKLALAFLNHICDGD